MEETAQVPFRGETFEVESECSPRASLPGNAPSNTRKSRGNTEPDLEGRALSQLADSSFQDEMLDPGTTFRKMAWRTVSPLRLGVFLTCVILSGFGLLYIDSNNFQVTITLSDVHSLRSCVHYCDRSRLEPGFSTYTGLCTDNSTHQSLVVFQECHRSSQDKVSKCEQIFNDMQLSPDTTAHTSRCRFPAVPARWKPFVVLTILVMVLMLILQGFNKELLLLGGGCLFCAFGIISSHDVFGGLSNDGVISLAMLFPISEAIAETGVLEKAVGGMLGSPTSILVALPRVMIPTALLSAFLSNTATVAMMIPILTAWCRRLGVHPGKIMMPLSFAAQLGGSWTLVGSSHILVAKAVIPPSMYDMAFFDLTPLGVLITVVTTLFIMMLARTPLLASSIADDDDEGSPATGSVDTYQLRLIAEAGLAGKTIADSGLARLPGVYAIHRASDYDENAALSIGEELIADCTEIGVITLRGLTDVRLHNQETLALLGAHRRERHLYEVTIKSKPSPLVREFHDARVVRKQLGACVVAGPKAPLGSERDLEITAGSVMLLEASVRYPFGRAANEWASCFSLVHQIPGSSPPRAGRRLDVPRNTCTCLAALILIALVTAEKTKLSWGGGVLLIFYIFIGSLSPRQLFNSIRVDILLIIAGALAIGEGLQQSGVVNCLSSALIGFAKPYGKFAITAIIYIVIWVIQLFINNSAVVAIIGPMIVRIAEEDPSIDVKVLVWTMVYAAGSSFTSPLGYQTNLMVQPVGKYSFGDFVTFGGIVQAFNFISVVIFVTLLAPLLPGS